MLVIETRAKGLVRVVGGGEGVGGKGVEVVSRCSKVIVVLLRLLLSERGTDQLDQLFENPRRARGYRG